MGCEQGNMYKNDKIWNEAKKVARAHGFSNNWIEIIDYYNAQGGTHVQIFCVIEESQSRILYILDDESILLMNRDKEVEVKGYDEVFESPKVFFYLDEPKITRLQLPKGYMYANKKEVQIAI